MITSWNGNIFRVTGPLAPVASPHKGQWRGAWFYLICAWTNSWANKWGAVDLIRHRAYYDATVISRRLNLGAARIVKILQIYIVWIEMWRTPPRLSVHILGQIFEWNVMISRDPLGSGTRDGSSVNTFVVIFQLLGYPITWHFLPIW